MNYWKDSGTKIKLLHLSRLIGRWFKPNFESYVKIYHVNFLKLQYSELTSRKAIDVDKRFYDSNRNHLRV